MKDYINLKFLSKEALLAEAVHYIAIIDAKDRYIDVLTSIIYDLNKESEDSNV